MLKSIIFIVKSFLGNFYRQLAIFIWSHCHWPSPEPTACRSPPFSHETVGNAIASNQLRSAEVKIRSWAKFVFYQLNWIDRNKREAENGVFFLKNKKIFSMTIWCWRQWTIIAITDCLIPFRETATIAAIDDYAKSDKMNDFRRKI